MPTDEEVLESWSLLASYWRHRKDLRDLALAASLSLCRLWRKVGQGPPTCADCQENFAEVLVRHPLYTKVILRRERPHIPPDMYEALGQILARYTVHDNWLYIRGHPC